jgi:hypothetical protein
MMMMRLSTERRWQLRSPTAWLSSKENPLIPERYLSGSGSSLSDKEETMFVLLFEPWTPAPLHHVSRLWRIDYHHRESSPFCVTTFHRRFFQFWSCINFFGFCNDNFSHSKVASLEAKPPTPQGQFLVFMSSSDNVAQLVSQAPFLRLLRLAGGLVPET